MREAKQSPGRRGDCFVGRITLLAVTDNLESSALSPEVIEKFIKMLYTENNYQQLFREMGRYDDG